METGKAKAGRNNRIVKPKKVMGSLHLIIYCSLTGFGYICVETIDIRIPTPESFQDQVNGE